MDMAFVFMESASVLMVGEGPPASQELDAEANLLALVMASAETTHATAILASVEVIALTPLCAQAIAAAMVNVCLASVCVLLDTAALTAREP